MNPRVAGTIAKAAGPLFHPIVLSYLLIHDVGSWRFVPAWFRSFRRTFSPLSAAVPWLPFKATSWLESYLRSDMKVFEYGSGGSTIFLTRHSGEVFTVEHDRIWHGLVAAALSRRGVTNCRCVLCEPRPIERSSTELSGSGCESVVPDERQWEYPGMDFSDYVNTINAYPDRSFDLILVDGRARGACLRQAVRKIRAGCYVMLDNSNNPEFAEALAVMGAYERIDFHGIAPGWPPARWTTSVWHVV